MEQIVLSVDTSQNIHRIAWVYVVKAKAGWRCERCGSDKELNAHHLDRDIKNNRLENGECLCRECHVEEHGGHGFHYNRNVKKEWETKRKKYGENGLSPKQEENRKGWPKGKGLSPEHRQKISEGLQKAHTKS